MPGLMACREEYDEQPLRRRPHLRISAHDHPDRGPHRDPQGPRRRRPLVLVQHLLHPGPRRCRHCPRRGRCRLRLEGRDPRGVLGVHPQRAHLARGDGKGPDDSSSTTAVTRPSSSTREGGRGPSSRTAPSPTPAPPTSRVQDCAHLIKRLLESGETDKWTRSPRRCDGVSEETTTGVHRLYRWRRGRAARSRPSTSTTPSPSPSSTTSTAASTPSSTASSVPPTS